MLGALAMTRWRRARNRWTAPLGCVHDRATLCCAALLGMTHWRIRQRQVNWPCVETQLRALLLQVIGHASHLASLPHHDMLGCLTGCTRAAHASDGTVAERALTVACGYRNAFCTWEHACKDALEPLIALASPHCALLVYRQACCV